MEDNVSKIKDRLDAVEVIGGYVKLQKAGINYKGRCPFHNEKTPSFFVSPERQVWHCFGCGKGGDMFEFVKEIEGVEFPEALKILADKAGIELERFKPMVGQEPDVKDKLFEICELVTKFFEKQFQSSAGKLALQYLYDRGLVDETIKEFRLGFAPNDWEALSKFLESRGYKEKEIIDAGLAIKRDDSKGRQGIYDRFRSRIIFPIFEVTGRVVGFTGRSFDLSTIQTGGIRPGLDQPEASMAKYINTPQTLIYDKSRVLYGLSKAKLDIKKADRCILVEGNMDALMSYQAGAKNVVASSGTALTPTHLRLLRRYTKNLGFCFDTDQAGAMATHRGIGLALAQQFNIQILEIKDPECKDPADYVKKYGPKWSEVVASAKPVIDYYFDRARSSYNPTSASSKSEMISVIAPFLKRLPAQVERAHWIAQLSALLRVPEQAIVTDIQTAKDDLDAYVRPEENVPEVAKPAAENIAIKPSDPATEMLVSIVLKNPNLFQDEIKNLPEELIENENLEILTEIANTAGPFQFKEFVSGFSSQEAMNLEFAYLRSQELWQEFNDESLKEEFQKLVDLLRRRAIQNRLASLQFDVREAEASGDEQQLARLASEFQTLAQKLTLINKNNGSEEKAKTKPPESQSTAETQGQNFASEESGI